MDKAGGEGGARGAGGFGMGAVISEPVIAGAGGAEAAGGFGRAVYSESGRIGQIQVQVLLSVDQQPAPMLTTRVVCIQDAGEAEGQGTVRERLQAIQHPLPELAQLHQAMGVTLGDMTAAVKKLEDDLKP